MEPHVNERDDGIGVLIYGVFSTKGTAFPHNTWRARGLNIGNVNGRPEGMMSMRSSFMSDG